MLQSNKKVDSIKSNFPISIGKLEGLILIGLLGVGAFDLAMYADIAITGIPLDIPSVLGKQVLGEHQYANFVGHLIHIGNGIGLSLLFGYVVLPISRKIVKLPTVIYGIAFAALETVVAVWLVLLPALGAGIAGINIAPEVAVMTMTRHIVLGLVFGASVRRWNN